MRYGPGNIDKISKASIVVNEFPTTDAIAVPGYYMER